MLDIQLVTPGFVQRRRPMFEVVVSSLAVGLVAAYLPEAVQPVADFPPLYAGPFLPIVMLSLVAPGNS